MTKSKQIFGLMYKCGIAKVEVTAEVLDVGMMGYGINTNIVKGVESPLFARAFVFEDENGNRWAYVNAEIAFISSSVSRGVLDTIAQLVPNSKLSRHNILLSAQHTHSSTGGYMHYPFFNITIPGYVPKVWESYVYGISKAILEAIDNMEIVKLRFGSIELPPNRELAINRSLESFNNNRDTDNVDLDQAEFAIDRKMTLLRIDREDGTPKGAISWFGVHCTSISSNNQLINSDNKGYAAKYFEEDQKLNDFVAIFAQNSAGDISPNSFWDKEFKWTRGPFKSDIENAKHNGKIQFDAAKRLFNKLKNADELKGRIDFKFNYFDFRNIKVYPEFADGKQGMTTSPAALGVAFFKGTKEGPGLPKPVIKLCLNPLSNLIKLFDRSKAIFSSEKEKKRINQIYKSHWPKHVILETGDQRLIGINGLHNLAKWLPPLSKDLKVIKKHASGSKHISKPWTVQVLPLQIIIMGPLALVAIPGETSITAGKRIQKLVKSILKDRGVEDVQICPYSNAYSGYITTQEEYVIQNYEGGHTVFGRWTLGAHLTKLKQMAVSLVNEPFSEPEAFSVLPTYFPNAELKLRLFEPND